MEKSVEAQLRQAHLRMSKLLQPIPEGHWRFKAACRGMDPELFVGDSKEDQSDAIEVCGRCAVRAECLQYALETTSTKGVWGGTTEEDRAQMRQKHLRR